MYGVVKIGTKEVPMLAMASADVYYKRIFGADPLKTQIKDDFDAADAVDLIQRMGFVMAKFAEVKTHKDMLKLNEDSYLEWLDGFDRADLIDAIGDIRKVYDGEKATASAPKNEEGQYAVPGILPCLSSVRSRPV